VHSQGVLDSLKKKLSTSKNDSARLEWYYRYAILKKLTKKSSDSLRDVIEVYTRSNSCRIKAMAYYKLGCYGDATSNNEAGFKNLQSALKLGEKCNDDWIQDKAYNRLAGMNGRLKNFTTALGYSRKAIYFSEKCGVKTDLADAYEVLGAIFKDMESVDSSVYYIVRALKLYEVYGTGKTVGNSLNTIGLLYKKQKKYQLAYEYFEKAIQVKKKVKDHKGVAGAQINAANCLRELGEYKKALEYATEGMYLARKILEGEYLRNGLYSMASIYHKMGNYKMSSEIYVRHRGVDDSIKINIIDKNFQELQQKYESDKKDAEIRKKEGDINLEKTRNRMKNILITFALIAIALAAVAIVFIFRSYSRSKRNANDLAQKNKVIAEKNKEITDSINYAQNIQQSLLTGETIFKENLIDYFILFKPKDIVSGDFYWAKKSTNGFMIMCADCTGHGVPGAFMSLLGISYLNEITGAHNLQRPDEVLNELRSSLINGFGLKDNKDGMDASFIKLNGTQLEMAAANNPVWVIRNNQNIILKPNKFPIGKHHGQMQNFTLNTIDTCKNDLIIMLTDGFADQFGGPKNKKYKYKNLEQLIIQNSSKPLKDLKEILNKEITEWKGRNEQVDDILLIGIRV